jgi:hypothetical protein
MISEEANGSRLVKPDLGIAQSIRAMIAREEHFRKWMEHPSSMIVHHDKNCCDEARLWFLSYARSMEIKTLSQFELRAPVWLSQLYTWGPSEWPISWCELVKEKVLDCGVFAALAREVFRAQGHEAHPAQALLSYNPSCTGHWKEFWKGDGKKEKKKDKDKKKKKNEEGETFPWIGTEVVYHEICVLEMPDGSAKVYDSTWGNWYEPHARAGFGALLAVRTECPRVLSWGNKFFSCGEWIEI